MAQEDVMAFKPNYNQQRNERRLAKEKKKQEKLQRRADEAAARRQTADADPEEHRVADKDTPGD
jgi:hypothetical protein